MPVSSCEIWSTRRRTPRYRVFGGIAEIAAWKASETSRDYLSVKLMIRPPANTRHCRQQAAFSGERGKARSPLSRSVEQGGADC
jgi:uncharacterized protein (DUF736 family)